MEVEKFVLRSGIAISTATLILLIWFIPAYIQRIHQVQTYLDKQNREFQDLEKEAWEVLKQSKREKRQWNQTPQGDWEPEEEEFIDQDRRPFVHLPTPIIPQPFQRPAPSPCQCSNYNECPDGPIGVQGRSGIDGIPGSKGAFGARGLPGRVPSEFFMVFQGCRVCPMGKKGEKGSRGQIGPQGRTGETGEIGATGKKGVTGKIGDQGQIGVVGRRGFDGLRGEDGLNAIRYEKGLPGFKGVRGPMGQKGSVGAIGADGKQGIRGNIGLPGQRGDPGKSGLQGVPGGIGSIGFPGADATYCPCPRRSSFKKI